MTKKPSPRLGHIWLKRGQRSISFQLINLSGWRINTHVSINIIRGMIKTGLDLSHGIFFLVPATVLSGMRNAAVLQKFVSRSFCVFAHNWHFIFCSSTTTALVQIFRLQTDNWVFISKLYQELFTVWLSHYESAPHIFSSSHSVTTVIITLR